MNIKSIVPKLAGGLFAVGIAATAIVGQAGQASADKIQCQPPQCPVIDIRPDLTVQNLDVSKGANGKLVVTFQEKNQGAGASGAARMKVYVNGAVAYQQLSPGMSAGQGINHLLNLPLPALGKAQVEVMLDTDGDVNESNEFNNSASDIAGW